MTAQTSLPGGNAIDAAAPLRLLVVDDSLPDRVHLSWLLRRGLGKQVEIIEAEDGAGALDALRRGPVDLMLVDYLLPDMNGLDVLDRASELPGEVATVFLTGQGNEKIAAEAIKRGAHDYCIKRDLAWDKLQRTVSQSLAAARLKRQNTQMVEQLRRMHQELDHFVRALSHDLSANFMLLDDSVRQLRRTCDPSPLAPMLEGFTHVEACLRESKRFVDDLVTLARTGGIQMEPERVELAGLVEEALFEQTGLLDERGVRVTVASEMPAVWCNRGRVKQVFVNLIRNAVRHGCDRQAPEIRISALERPDMPRAGEVVWLRIFDNGPGIPLRSREDIFLPGKRLPGAHPQGTGTGLAIVRKIVEHYGGSIFVDSSCQQGAGFIFSLPSAAAGIAAV